MHQRFQHHDQLFQLVLGDLALRPEQVLRNHRGVARQNLYRHHLGAVHLDAELQHQRHLGVVHLVVGRQFLRLDRQDAVLLGELGDPCPG
jgi:hypothetical protein